MRTQKEINEFFKTVYIRPDAINAIYSYLSDFNLKINISSDNINKSLGLSSESFMEWFNNGIEAQKTIEFDGTGNVLVGIDILEKGKVSCTFNELDEGVGLGSYVHKNNNFKYKSKTIMTFVNSKSIDCVINKLSSIRDYLKMEEEGIEIPDDLIRLYPFLKTNKI